MLVVAELVARRAGGRRRAELAAPARRRRRPAIAKPWTMPRTPDGKPDLQGNWTNATLTPLERPATTRRWSMSKEQVATARKGLRRSRRPAGRRTAIRIGPRRPRAATARPAPPATSAATTTSGSIPAIASRSSTASTAPSLIVDPPNGRVPAHDARGAAARRRQRLATTQGARAVRPSRAAAAGRALPDVVRLERRAADAAELLLQQQLPDRADQGHVMILVEMVHDVRVIRIGGDLSACPRRCGRGWAIRSAGGKATRWSSKPPTSTRCSVPRRLREPQGHRAVHAAPAPTPSSTSSRSTTRRRSPSQWGGEVPFSRTDELIYEYACHEGNYALVERAERRAEPRKARGGAEEDQQ